MAVDGHFVPAPRVRRPAPASSPAPSASAAPSAPARGTDPTGPGARLPWWALVLPALAFAVLLAFAADGGGPGAAIGLVGHLRDVLPHPLAAAR